MGKQVNIALQIIPQSKKCEIFSIVDEAIKVISNSGIKYTVCPFETVLEGDYDEIMIIVKEAQEACLKFGADSLISNLKIEWHNDKDASIREKMNKYS